MRQAIATTAIELEISSRQHQTGNWELLFAVSDTGPGISQEDLAHIFDPFFQTRHSLSIGGLGLHVAWTIAQKMGGSLTASSELGTGSCFLFAVSVTASVPELPNERYCVTDSGADCEWMQDADFPDVPPDFCQRILELIDMGAVSEIDELLDYLYAKEMISPTLFSPSSRTTRSFILIESPKYAEVPAAEFPRTDGIPCAPACCWRLESPTSTLFKKPKRIKGQVQGEAPVRLSGTDPNPLLIRTNSGLGS